MVSTCPRSPDVSPWRRKNMVPSDTRKKPHCRSCGSAMQGHHRGSCPAKVPSPPKEAKVETSATNLINTAPVARSPTASTFIIPPGGRRVNPYLSMLPEPPRSLSYHPSWVQTSIMDSHCVERRNPRPPVAEKPSSAASEVGLEDEPGLDAPTHNAAKARHHVQLKYGCDIFSISAFDDIESAQDASFIYTAHSVQNIVLYNQSYSASPRSDSQHVPRHQQAPFCVATFSDPTAFTHFMGFNRPAHNGIPHDPISESVSPAASPKAGVAYIENSAQISSFFSLPVLSTALAILVLSLCAGYFVCA